MLAGVSVDYYTRLERGNLAGASESVLDALARALQLDESERAHLFDLARAANASPATRRQSTPARRVRPGVQRVLDAMTEAPAWVRNGRADVLATNRLGRALYAPVFEDPVQPANTARFAFLSRAEDFYRDWDRTAADIVAVLRAAAGRNPYDKALTDLIGELSTRSEVFRTWWAAHDVLFHRTGRKHLHHPVVGDLDLTYEAFELPSDPGLTMLVYTAEPDTATAEALGFLASWRDQRSRPKPRGRATIAQNEDIHGDPEQATDRQGTGADVHRRRLVRRHRRGETPSRVRVNNVRFAPGARTAWHSHAVGQTLYVTEGSGLVQARGGDVVELRPGDAVWTPPGEEHWHGAAPEHFMTHIAIWEAPDDDRDETTWGGHVTDAEYGGHQH